MPSSIDKTDAYELEALIQRMAAADMGDGGEAELRALDAHLSGNPARQELHASVLALWDQLGKLEAPAAIAAPAPAGALAFWRRAPRQALVAALAPLLALAGLLAIALGSFGTGHYRTELHASNAERRIVNLPDGSTVSLSADSAVAVDLSPGRRNFVLKRGEALFDVAHDPARPFIVAAGDGVIQAIGTAFNVKLGASGVVVTVVEGTVKIEAGKQAAQRLDKGLVQLASAGQQVRYGIALKASDGSAFVTRPATVDPGRYTSWADGFLRFQGEPLSQVIAEVNRHSARDIRLTDPALANTPIYGVLHIGDVEGLKSIVADIQSLDRETVSDKLEVVASET